MRTHPSALRVLRARTQTPCRRRLSSQAHAPPPPPPPRSPAPSPHARFYTDYAAGMIPVALLGSAVYIGLRTWQQHLAHERFLEEAHAHVQQLEAEVLAQRERLQAQANAASAPPPPEAKKRTGWLPWSW